jgi:hypothetical protein
MPANKKDKPKKPVETPKKAPAKPEPPKKSLIETVPEPEIELTEADFLDEPEHPHQVVHVKKVDFAAMCEILHALHMAYMPGDKDEPNERFLACWHTCLVISGWDEGDFWQCYDGEDPCPVCGEEQGDVDEEDEVLALPPKPDPKKMAN